MTVFSTPQPLHPFREHICRRQPASMRSSLQVYIYIRTMCLFCGQARLIHSWYGHFFTQPITNAHRKRDSSWPRGPLLVSGAHSSEWHPRHRLSYFCLPFRRVFFLSSFFFSFLGPLFMGEPPPPSRFVTFEHDETSRFVVFHSYRK